ncbi:hypothetical protein EVAR_65615_1 [Eumeta japonica]|uniref:Uncharacterized protein n=1 Tax=Eumeta variegata TaxID=151549 RepID=A0A4C1ZEV6_EUMVA|nr:hypothetical protein EVAR_65615_1 [Eumeta japonica]
MLNKVIIGEYICLLDLGCWLSWSSGADGGENELIGSEVLFHRSTYTIAWCSQVGHSMALLYAVLQKENVRKSTNCPFIRKRLCSLELSRLWMVYMIYDSACKRGLVPVCLYFLNSLNKEIINDNDIIITSGMILMKAQRQIVGREFMRRILSPNAVGGDVTLMGKNYMKQIRSSDGCWKPFPVDIAMSRRVQWPNLAEM